MLVFSFLNFTQKSLTLSCRKENGLPHGTKRAGTCLASEIRKRKHHRSKCYNFLKNLISEVKFFESNLWLMQISEPKPLTMNESVGAAEVEETRVVLCVWNFAVVSPIVMEKR